MIIVEGPDGSGKTTLINQLAERYGLEVNPRVVSKQTEALVDIKEWVTDNLSLGFQYKLFDRHRLISEFAYGPILRTTQHNGFTDLTWVYVQLRKFYRQVQPLVIYCLPPLHTVWDNLEYDKDNERVVAHTEQIYARYVHQASTDWVWRPESTIVWDYTRDFMIEKEPLNFFDHYMSTAKERANHERPSVLPR